MEVRRAGHSGTGRACSGGARGGGGVGHRNKGGPGICTVYSGCGASVFDCGTGSPHANVDAAACESVEGNVRTGITAGAICPLRAARWDAAAPTGGGPTAIGGARIRHVT